RLAARTYLSTLPCTALLRSREANMASVLSASGKSPAAASWRAIASVDGHSRAACDCVHAGRCTLTQAPDSSATTARAVRGNADRSEEHTSELQSPLPLLCRR